MGGSLYSAVDLMTVVQVDSEELLAQPHRVQHLIARVRLEQSLEGRLARRRLAADHAHELQQHGVMIGLHQQRVLYQNQQLRPADWVSGRVHTLRC